MSEKSNPTRGGPLEAQSNGSQGTAAEEYKVGPGRPPPDKRWKKGGPSPNPRGRPRNEQSGFVPVFFVVGRQRLLVTQDPNSDIGRGPFAAACRMGSGIPQVAHSCGLPLFAQVVR